MRDDVHVPGVLFSLDSQGVRRVGLWERLLQLFCRKRVRHAHRARNDLLFQSNVARYAFGLAAVAVALAIRILATPWIGMDAPFVLFCSALLLTGLLAGPGPAFASVVIGFPLGVVMFVVFEGDSLSRAVLQVSLYAIDGLVIVYVAALDEQTAPTSGGGQ